MLDSIWQDIRRQFQFGNRVTQLVLVNVAVFIIVNLAHVLLQVSNGYYDSLVHFFAVSSGWLHNLTHPWVFLTYAFVHEGLWHVLFNMLIFYWFGRIVGDLIGDNAILPLYVWGALAGGLAYFTLAALIPGVTAGSNGFLIGASASVFATVVAGAVIAPEYGLRLLLIGEVRLKYVALALILLDVFRLGFDGNMGGHIAHFGGMAMGYVFVSQLRAGNNLGDPINRMTGAVSDFFSGSGKPPAKHQPGVPRSRPSITSSVRKRVRKSKPAPPSNVAPDRQARLDVILDKIKANGIESLTAEERDFLSLASRDET